VPSQDMCADVAVLGLPGFRVMASDEVDGELEVIVATTAQRAWYGSCGVRAHSQGRPAMLVCDVDAPSTGACGCGGSNGAGAIWSRRVRPAPGPRPAPTSPRGPC
jgi:hypothetical protein